MADDMDVDTAPTTTEKGKEKAGDKKKKFEVKKVRVCNKHCLVVLEIDLEIHFSFHSSLQRQPSTYSQRYLGHLTWTVLNNRFYSGMQLLSGLGTS
jgi:hypothetical protein